MTDHINMLSADHGYRATSLSDHMVHVWLCAFKHDVTCRIIRMTLWQWALDVSCHWLGWKIGSIPLVSLLLRPVWPLIMPILPFVCSQSTSCCKPHRCVPDHNGAAMLSSVESSQTLDLTSQLCTVHLAFCLKTNVHISEVFAFLQSTSGSGN